MKDKFFDLVLRSLAGFKSFLYRISGKFGVQMPQPEYGVPQPMYGIPPDQELTIWDRIIDIFEQYGLLIVFIPVSILIVVVFGVIALIWKGKETKKS